MYLFELTHMWFFCACLHLEMEMDWHLRAQNITAAVTTLWPETAVNSPYYKEKY